MPKTPYPLALSEDLMAEVSAAASDTGLSTADVMRRSMKLGLPKLRKQLAAAGGPKAFTKAESRQAFGPDPEWERLEGVMARRPLPKPERD